MTSKSIKKQTLSKAGIGLKNIKSLYHYVGINQKLCKIQLKTKQQKNLTFLTNIYSFSETLKLKVKRATNFYVKIKSYKGVRQNRGYPVRGQRTHTNAKTARKKL